MTDLAALYQSVVLDHNKNPRNFGEPESYSQSAEGFNPLCGDHYHIYLSQGEAGKVGKVFFKGQGCAISKASASLMSQISQDLSEGDFLKLFEAFQNMVTGKSVGADEKQRLGKLRVFEEVWKYPSRVKCAALPWHTLKAALAGKKTASTEE